MFPEFGLMALSMAAAISLCLAVVPAVGVRFESTQLMRLADPFAALLFLLILVSYIYLTLSFLQDDFSVLYVVNHSNSQLPWYYKFSAVWGSHEGSMLLWVLVLAAWTLAVSLFSRHLPDNFRALALASQGILTAGFVFFVLLTSNPFERMLPFPAPDGADLNPLLQDIGLIIHPPMLYMGYVGFSVAFSFAIAALILGRFDKAWAEWLRPWTNAAWLFLTLGISLGSWWAYYELGWGGWWFWDPVENASLMPWLLGTALVHSLSVSRTRNLFHSWTILLAIFSFSLSLLGTFLVRSGVLTSVHAFASDPERGAYILMFLLAVTGSALLLYALRMGKIEATEGFAPLSRESSLLFNNLIMTLFALVVLLGTLYPLVIEALGLQSVSVGPPYFNSFLLLLGVPLLLVMGYGQRARWRIDSLSQWLKQTPAPLALSLLVILMLYLLGGYRSPVMLLTIGLAAWLFLHLVADGWQRLQASGARRLMANARWWGMALAHLGLVVTTVGIGYSAHLSDAIDARMAPGDSEEVSGYRFELESFDRQNGPNYVADVATLNVYRGERRVALLQPEKRLYNARGDVMTEAGISAGVYRDLYVSMGEPLENGAWAMRLQVKPMMRWVWGGTLLMALGALVALFDRRQKGQANR